MQRLLLPFSFLYGIAAAARNFAFTAGLLRVRRVGVPVVSVGNLTAGGTGKTPLAEFIVRWFLARGKRVGVVSRGYGRRTSGVVTVSDGSSLLADALDGGDEPVQIARKYPTVPVVVAERRVDAARTAAGNLGVEVLVLDDGFQHRYLHRDVDLVVMDEGNDVTKEPLLPAGLRRESLSSLRRARLIVTTRAGNERPPWLLTLRRWYPGAIVRSAYVPDGFFRVRDSLPVSSEGLRECRVLAFSGIADPRSFLSNLNAAGLRVVDQVRFPDHHEYREADFTRLGHRLNAAGATIGVTTEKDAVRILAAGDAGRKFLDACEIYFLRISLKPVDAGEEIDRVLEECMRQERR